jgi:hypothetical protein
MFRYSLRVAGSSTNKSWHTFLSKLKLANSCADMRCEHLLTVRFAGVLLPFDYYSIFLKEKYSYAGTASVHFRESIPLSFVTRCLLNSISCDARASCSGRDAGKAGPRETGRDCPFPACYLFLSLQAINSYNIENKNPYRDAESHFELTAKKVGTGCVFHQECALSDPKSVCTNRTCQCGSGLIWLMGNCQVNGQPL